MSGSGKSEQKHVPHFLHENVNRKFLDVLRCTHANERQGNVQKIVLQLDVLLFFTILPGHPTTVFCKISVQRSKFCLEFSFR